MKSTDIEFFEQILKMQIPTPLVKLFNDEALSVGQPVEFHSSEPRFVLGIQFLRDLRDAKNYDIEGKRVRFAVNTDGFDLIADLTSNTLPIWQDEFGQIDYLLFSIEDLLNAKRIVLM